MRMKVAVKSHADSMVVLLLPVSLRVLCRNRNTHAQAVHIPGGASLIGGFAFGRSTSALVLAEALRSAGLVGLIVRLTRTWRDSVVRRVSVVVEVLRLCALLRVLLLSSLRTSSGVAALVGRLRCCRCDAARRSLMLAARGGFDAIATLQHFTFVYRQSSWVVQCGAVGSLVYIPS